MVKYCQECGNPSYDGATICGNCGAKFPPKSEKNSKPPAFEEKGKKETKSDFNLSKTVGGFKNLSQKLKEEVNEDKNESTVEKTTIDSVGLKGLSKKISLETTKKDKEKPAQPVYGKSIVGFKEKDKGIKDPARKFKTVLPTVEKPKAEEVKEVKIKAPKVDKQKEDKSLDLPNFNKPTFNFNFTKKNIILIAIVAIILAAIIGASIASMTPQSNETLYYSDGTISFYYPGNWSSYNNTEDRAGEIAFKTPDKILIGFTPISGEGITHDVITNEINQTAISLGGSLIKYADITIDGLPATDITISSAEHGYSRYISVIHNGVYYSFVINNGQTNDPGNIDSLNSPDVQNMINSIKFTNHTEETSV